MQTFRIKRFRGIETKQEETTQDRTVLRKAEGCMVTPIGGICNPPEWSSLWDIENWAGKIKGLAAEKELSEEHAHFVTLYNGTEAYLVLWDYENDRPQMIRGLREELLEMHAEMTLDAVGWEEKLEIKELDAEVRELLGPSIVYIPEDEKYHDFEPGKRWFASKIGDRQFIGNGEADNRCWHEGRLRLLGPQGGVGRYDEAKIPFPPCISWVRADGGEIYGAGNKAQPLRIWVTNRPSAVHVFYEGIYNLDRSYVECRFTEATRIATLSHYQQTVVAHTDAGAVYYAGFEQTTDGYKARQRGSPVNSGAINPNCVADEAHGQFFFGRDLEIYHDHSVRAGSYDKKNARDEELATNRSSGDWNRDMAAFSDSEDFFTAFDRKRGIFWVFCPLALAGHGAYCYQMRGRAITGPMRFPDLIMGAISPEHDGPSSRLTAFTASGNLLSANLDDVGESRFEYEPRGVVLDPKYEYTLTEPTDDEKPHVGMREDYTFVLKVNGKKLHWPSPWEDPVETEEGAAKWYENATLSVIETSYLDFSLPNTLKDFENLQVVFSRQSRAYVGIYAESEGRTRGRFMGLVFGKENRRVRLNRKGERIRVRLFVITFNDAPSLIRDIEVFYLPGVAR